MSENLIDYDEAVERLGGDEEFLIELLNELVEQVNENYDTLKSAIVDTNYDELKAIAHGLKGAAANLNVTRMATHFMKLESMGSNQTIDGANEVLAKLSEDRDELVLFLSKN